MSDSTDGAVAKLTQTPLHALHIELGAKMVPFAGYEMPVQYPMGILSEHLHTRDKAGLFDVSHMGQVRLSGGQAASALESLVPIDVVNLASGQQRYALFTNADGGVLDDLMVTNAGDHLFAVVNADCKEQDIAHLHTHLDGRCIVENRTDKALLALQGPTAASVLAVLAPAANALAFMQAEAMDVAGYPCFVSRSGYTGEDGFEISVPNDAVEALARRLLEHADVEAIGLGARDSLRLEAGLCLYGHELDPSTTPVEASLKWALSKSRRTGGARAGGYLGANVINEQLSSGTARRRVGILPEGRAPIREGAELISSEGTRVGHISSGGFSPSLGAPIAMGYVETAYSSLDTKLSALVRGKPRPVSVAKLPFVAQRYHRN
jgi:aminomethyltransferase